MAAINTIQSVMGINLNTLRPEPSVEGYSTPGGYSCKAVKPIALAKARRLCRAAPGLGERPASCCPSLHVSRLQLMYSPICAPTTSKADQWMFDHLLCRLIFVPLGVVCHGQHASCSAW